MEKQVLDLVEGMVKVPFEVFVWCPPGQFVKDYEKVGAKVTLKKIRLDIDPFYILSLARFMKKNQIDVIHGHELKAVVNMLIAGSIAKVKMRVSHTHTPISHWRVSRIKKFLDMLLYTAIVNIFSTHEIALTESIRAIKEEEGINPYKIQVITNGVDVKKFELSQEEKFAYKEEIHKLFNIPKDAYVIGNLSRLTVEKDHETLVKAFDKLKIDNKFLLIAGGGGLEKDIKNLVSKLGLDNQVVITGLFEESMKVKLLSTLDLVAFTSLAEGFGYILVESMLFGLPIISSDLPVLQEVGGEYISYFKVGDVDSLVGGVEMFYKDQKGAAQRALLAQNRAKSLYSIETFWGSYESLYKGNLK